MSKPFSETATEALVESFAARRSRRTLLKGAAVTTLMAAGTTMLSIPAVGAAAGNQQAIIDILTVARTAEQLAVTFYSNGVANAKKLKIRKEQLENLKAALIEEQIHQLFFTANGGQSLADTFSFPKGAQTFEDLQTFIATQQQLEGVFDSAFLAAVKEFSIIGEHRLAQIAAQVACIESEHRALGRDIAGLVPADNWAYAPVLIAKVADAPAAVAAAGYLSPKPGNSYKYQQVGIDDGRIIYRTPFTVAGD